MLFHSVIWMTKMWASNHEPRACIASTVVKTYLALVWCGLKLEF